MVLATCALMGMSFSANAQAPNVAANNPQTVLPNGKYRGGNDLVGHGCSLGPESCQVGIFVTFAPNSAGKVTAFYRDEVGSGTYKALKDGNPYSFEDNMPLRATMPVVVDSDGTFSFRWSAYIYDKCRSIGPDASGRARISCFFHKTQGISQNWVTLTNQ
jgi:hypothetical protein